ncbi:PAS domain-containing protein [Thalassolituus hydrocarboniclasticus]|uniref:PAS domain-containing protein n=1 Tax=Thalassolituus hydrocarboniclasticus TaxID=2742796 RepID=A0ABY6A9L5_9GAMM|nr:PAS domain-containing protein [Thalassolituus hydrocarboniclasticus]UXD87692.1 PAS domain-containing protein [Thalassolituus hydrocarboniclasticus]
MDTTPMTFDSRDLSLLSLKASALDSLLGHSDLGLAILDTDLRYRAINPTLARFNGLSVDEHLGRSVGEVFPHLASVVEPLLLTVIRDGKEISDIEVQAETPSTPGRRADWLATYRPIMSATGQVLGVLVIAVNHTVELELKRTKEEAATLVRSVIDSLMSFVGIMEPDGTLIDANKAPLDAAGIKLEDVLGKKFWDCFWWSYDLQVQQQLRDAVALAVKGEIVRYDVVIRTADDSRMIIDFMLAPLKNAQGEIVYLIPSAIDITARVAGENMLKYSEERFRRVVESTQDGLILVDEEGRIQLVNRRSTEMFGYDSEQLLQLTVEDLVPDSIKAAHSDLRRGYLQAPQARAMAAMRELYARRRDGSLFPVEIGLTPLNFPEGHRILATIVDISVQKSIQQNLIRSLNEKTALLNEVHHRVKNNLQVVSSLLSLQARSAPEDVRSYFDESQGRIKAMALIHQLLYEQKNFDRIEAVSYMRRLGDLLKRSYFSAMRNVQLVIESDHKESYLALDIALPFGLLINELVTNAIKHAFPDHDGGEIRLTLSEDGAKKVLIIADNGIGLPQGGRPGTSNSLGFQLIPGLVEQMHATLDVLDAEGAVFQLIIHDAGLSDEQP